MTGTHILASAGVAFPPLYNLVGVLALFCVTHRFAHVQRAGFAYGPSSAKKLCGRKASSTKADKGQASAGAQHTLFHGQEAVGTLVLGHKVANVVLRYCSGG